VLYNKPLKIDSMKFSIIRKSIVVLIILSPLIADLGCKKQTRCGCGKDVLFTLTDGDANVYWTADYKTIFFYSITSSGSTYYFCNPGKWADLLKTFTSGQELLVTGDAYYDCTYLMNSGNQGYATPPIYQVNVTNLKKNNYAK
jgi:hypothetical protein